MKTEKITLRGKGKATINKLEPDGPGIRIANDFLSKLTKESVAYASSYIDTLNEAPFTFLERQSGGMIASGLAKFADAFLMEAPVFRKINGQTIEKYGWADFWAHYRESDFFIELKQSYYSLKSNEINQEVKDAWSKGYQQIRSFKQKSLGNYCITSKAVLLSFQIIPLYITLKSSNDLGLFTNENYLGEIKNKLVKELTPSPSWSYLWKMKEEMTMNTCRCVGESNRYYPAVIFLSRIETISFHHEYYQRSVPGSFEGCTKGV